MFSSFYFPYYAKEKQKNTFKDEQIILSNFPHL